MKQQSHKLMKIKTLVRLLLAILANFTIQSTHAADTILHNFTDSSTDGYVPEGSLTLSGSTLYGTAVLGGNNSNSGTIYSVNTDGTGFTLIHSFADNNTDGARPSGSLTLSGSTLFGVTKIGGINNGGNGTIYSVNTDGSGYSVLHSFTGSTTDGGFPGSGLTLSGTTLYGVTSDLTGSGTSSGTIFSMNTDGSGFTLLHSFSGGSADGANPFGSLTLSGSTLYGMTFFGGSGSNGTIFSISTSGTGFNLLHSFTGSSTDGANPTGSLTLSGSTLYGMTQSGGLGGTIFSISTSGTGFSLLHSFDGTGVSDGFGPQGSLTLSGSTLYGMAGSGGSGRRGIIFSISTSGTNYSILQNFAGSPSDGADPEGNVTLSADGRTLYGMTTDGGTADEGVIFSAPATASVPEPSAWALLFCGLAALTGLRFSPAAKPRFLSSSKSRPRTNN
jgi:uncharacterized repeat protein (TIGR03803 family)